jgi:two-component system cell cycle response regulator
MRPITSDKIGNRTIEIIEDARQVAAALSVRLRAAGYKVLTASDSRSGLQLAREHRPDLILLDVFLPSGPAFGLVEQLKQQLPNVPFIFLTASRKPELWAMAQEAGAAGYFEKPFPAEDLLAAIERILATQVTPAADSSQAAPREARAA